MIVGRVFFPVKVLGYGNRIGIWSSGCKRNCVGCASPELKKEDLGTEITLGMLDGIVSNIKDKIDGVTISGGEPFDQPKALMEYVRYFNDIGIDDIIVYTGYTYKNLKGRDEYTNYVLDNIAVLVDGEYIENFDDGIGLRGSSNQNIIIFKYKNRHKMLGKCDRVIQPIILKGHITYIGIPVKAGKISGYNQL